MQRSREQTLREHHVMNREDHLAELLERYETARSTGSSLTPEDVCPPELLDDFRARLRALDALDTLFESAGATVSAAERVAGIEAGRYRARNHHASGGLGDVFVAEDGELERNVALKCMQALYADDADSQ